MKTEKLDLIWNALGFYREHGIPEGDREYDRQWMEICNAMAQLRDDPEIEGEEND